MGTAKKPTRKVAKASTASAEAEPVPEPVAQRPSAVAVAAAAAAAPVLGIPEGKPKSGRVWKTKQQARFSTMTRTGMMSFLSTSHEQKQALRSAHQNMKDLEREMKEEKKNKLAEEKRRREEQQKRRMANEYKNSVYQVIKPETMKGMSKKQLRMVRKTAMNKNGQVELVNAWGSGAPPAGKKGKRK